MSAQSIDKNNYLSNNSLAGINSIGDENLIGPDGLPMYAKGQIFLKIRNDRMTDFLKNTSSFQQFGLPSLDKIGILYNVKLIKHAFTLSKNLSQKVDNRILIPTDNRNLQSIFIVNFDARFKSFDIIKEYLQLPEVEYAELIPLNYEVEIPNDVLFGSEQHLIQMRCPEAWDIHHGEDGDPNIIIGICDTGIDWKHPDLTGNMYNNLGEDADADGRTIVFDGLNWVFDAGDINGIDDDGNGYVDDLSGWNFYTGDGTAQNNIMGSSANRHGTHVAGISAGSTNNTIGISSISWNVKFLGTKHGDNRSGTAIYYGYDGIVYLAEMGADVVNCSWGGYGYSQTSQIAVDYATSLGCLVVAASGNGNTSSPHFPSALDNVLSVSSVASNDKKAYYSNFGFTVDVSAPGGDVTVDGGILSTVPNNGYVRFQGTSMASPQVAGLAGYLKTWLPLYTVDQLQRRILANADNIDHLNPNYRGLLGSGRINVLNSILFENNKKFPLKLVTSGIHYNMVADYYNIGFNIQNYSMDGANNVKFEFFTDNPNIELLAPYAYGMIGAEGSTVTPAFLPLRVISAAPEWATIRVKMTGIDNSILVGSEYEFNIYCGQDAILVYSKGEGNTSSGKYINNFLTSNGFGEVVYVNDNFTNLIGFKYAFLSFGSGYGSDYSFFDNNKADIVKAFLEEGGKLYLDGGEAIGFEQVDNPELLSLLGIAQAFDGYPSSIFNGLLGEINSIAEGMIFNSTNQVYKVWMDYYIPSTGTPLFQMPGLGTVAVQNTGIFGQKSIVSSYALGLLVDEMPPSTKDILFRKILSYLGLFVETPQPVVLNFPENNAILNSENYVIFDWNPLNNIWNYQFQISKYSDFHILTYDEFVINPSHSFTSSFFSLDQNYYWRVRSQNNYGFSPWSEVRTFQVKEMKPEKPILVSPSFNSQVHTLKPTFNWEVTERTQTYMLEIARDVNFTNDYKSFAFINTNSFYFYPGLSNNTNYYWRVTAKNNAGYGPPSDVWVFKAYLCSSIPTLVSPYDGADHQTIHQTFTWNYDQYAQFFDLQIADNLNFQTPMNYFGINANSFDVTSGLETNKTYYWRVRSFNNCGYTDYSQAFSFSTDIIPFVINLENKSTCRGNSIELGTFSNGDLITVTGGSGEFSYNWSPSYGLLYADSPNPIALNPYSTRTYTLTVEDLVTGLILSKSLILSVYSNLNYSLPYFTYLSQGSVLYLNSKISSIFGGKPPYQIQWYDSENNSINPPYVSPPLGTYIYTLIVSDANNCSLSKKMMVVVTAYKETVIENAASGNEGTSIMFTYPNPTREQLNLQVNSLEKREMRFELINMLGQKVLNGSFGVLSELNTQIDLDKLTSGVYLLNFYSGDEIITQKIVKE